ncbi:MAG: hypothetical protein PF488_00285 [Patescibacteria group bacterium]|jgi:hypothetical protein|nr:hypothetical protein [Patescibacteria group bacterium]
MNFREYRGSLEASMKTLVTLKDRDSLVEHCKYIVGKTFDPTALKVEPYGDGPDNRIGWTATFIVTLKDYGIIGFLDSAC